MSRLIRALAYCVLLIGLVHPVYAFDCDASPEDVYSVYQAAARDNIGEIRGGNDKWWKEHANPIDAKVLEPILSATREWISESDSRGIFIAEDLRDAEANMNQLISKICSPKRKMRAWRACPQHFDQESECIQYFSKRYSKVREHIDKKFNELEKKAERIYSRVKSLAIEKLGLLPERVMIVTNSQLKDLRYGVEAAVEQKQLEQANYFAVRYVRGLLNQKPPELSQREFETSAEFSERQKKAMRKYQREMRRIRKNRDTIFLNRLQNNLGKIATVGYYLKSPEYNADTEKMRLTMALGNRKVKVWFPIDRSKARSVHDEIETDRWGYWVYAVFRREKDNEYIELRAFMLIPKKKSERPIRVGKLVEGEGVRLRIGEAAADQFEPTLEKLKREAKIEEQEKEQRERERRCQLLRARRDAYDTQLEYLYVLRRAGCV